MKQIYVHAQCNIASLVESNQKSSLPVSRSLVELATVDMKHQAVMLTWFCVIVVVRVAVGNEEGGDKSGTAAERVCPPKVADDDRSPLYVKAGQLVDSCVRSLKSNVSIWRNENATSEDIQYFCDEVCLRQSIFQECLKDQATNLEVCSSPNILNIFNIDSDLAIDTLDSLCADGARRFTTIMMWLSRASNTDPVTGRIRKCLVKLGTVLRAVDKSNVDIASTMFILHKELIKSVECVNQVDYHRPLKEIVEYLKNEILTSMKCIHPQERTLVACVAIKDLVSATSLCEAKTHNSKLNMYDILENEAGSCFDDVITMDARTHDNITSDNETLQNAMKAFCFRKGVVSWCLDDSKIVTETCANETQNNAFKLLADSVEKSLEGACLDDGKRLGDIMFEVYRLKRTGHGHAVWDCVEAAKSSRNELDEHRTSSLNMRFYHELEAFKGCLVVKLVNDETSVAAATSLIDETLNKIECVSADDGSAVRCESLMHHHH